MVQIKFSKQSLTWQIALAMTSIYIIWGSTYLAIRFAIETVPPFLMASLRFIIAGGLLYCWAGLRGTSRPSILNWRSATIIGGLLLFGGNGGVVWAEQTVPSGFVAILVATVPLWMVLIEAIRPGGLRPSKGILLGLVIGFLGMILLVGQNGFSGRVDVLGALIVVGATLSWALGSLYSRQAPLPKSAQQSTAMEMIMGGIILFAASIISNEWVDFNLSNVSLLSTLSIVYLIVFGSLIAFTAYIWLLRTTTAARVSTYAYVNPVVAVFLGWALAAETVTLGTIAAAAVIILSVVIITTYRSRMPPKKKTQVEENLEGRATVPIDERSALS